MNTKSILSVIGAIISAVFLSSCGNVPTFDIPVYTNGHHQERGSRPMGPPPSAMMNQSVRPMGQQPMMNQRRPMQRPPGYPGEQGGYNGRPPAGSANYGYSNRPRTGSPQRYSQQGGYYNQGQQRPIRRPNNYGDAASSYVDPQNPFRRPVIRYVPMDERRRRY